MGSRKITLYCCGCLTEVSPRLTGGREIYPHRPDLASLPFWRCDTCGNFVGCHHKTADRTRPLGCIPTAEIKTARQRIHTLLDPIWKSGRMNRSAIYAELAKRLGVNKYHTAEIRTLEEARRVYREVSQINDELSAPLATPTALDDAAVEAMAEHHLGAP